ncbi:MAG: twin-arginine translocation pathway signal protein [Betaproteobacteria bacterium]|nr:MAG: twin-arginine translocation pathway signal protein [Betaproteobacteria bacterium]
MQIRKFGMTCSILAIFVTLAACQSAPTSYKSSKAYAIDREAKASLNKLLQSNKDARNLKKNAVAILVFPKIYKAGFIVGAQYGKGALFNPKGRTIGYYNSFAASYGFQAGAQGFGYAVFFMDHNSLSYLDKSAGWELGVGPSLVIVDKGFGKNMTSTTLRKGVYAFVFDQKGIMAGAGIQGTKVTRINP